MSQDLDADVLKFNTRIADLTSKIAIERKCCDGAAYMLQKLRDANAIEQCEQNVQQAQFRLSLLLAEMLKVFQVYSDAKAAVFGDWTSY